MLTDAPAGADVRARGRAHVGAQSAVLRRPARVEPGRPGAVHHTRRPPSARAACCRSCGRRRGLIQAARDNIKDPPGIFVKVGIETMRGALTVHRRGAAARLCRRRRSASARRSRRCADRGVARRRRVHRVPRNRAGARRRARRSASAATSSSRSCGSTKASRFRSIGCSRSPTRELQDDAGGVQVARGPDERRRSARGLGARRRPSIRRRASWSASAASSSTSWRRFSSARR